MDATPCFLQGVIVPQEEAIGKDIRTDTWPKGSMLVVTRQIHTFKKSSVC